MYQCINSCVCTHKLNISAKHFYVKFASEVGGSSAPILDPPLITPPENTYKCVDSKCIGLNNLLTRIENITCQNRETLPLK